MQDLWYGDKRDRVKWATLVTLAKTHSITQVVWVVYYRSFDGRTLEIDGNEKPVPDEVWGHFSKIDRIQTLAQETKLTIDVYDEDFSKIDRKTYHANLRAHLERRKSSPKIVFLDPDTGIVREGPKREHVTVSEIASIWGDLQPGDILVAYQHADHTDGWLQERKKRFEDACIGATVLMITGFKITKDVAFFAALSNPKN